MIAEEQELKASNRVFLFLYLVTNYNKKLLKIRMNFYGVTKIKNKN